jgi:hypothetical protein
MSTVLALPEIGLILEISVVPLVTAAPDEPEVAVERRPV